MRKVYLTVTGTLTITVPVTVAMTIRADEGVNLDRVVKALAKQDRTTGADCEDRLLVEYGEEAAEDALREALNDGKLKVTDWKVDDSK